MLIVDILLTTDIKKSQFCCARSQNVHCCIIYRSTC